MKTSPEFFHQLHDNSMAGAKTLMTLGFLGLLGVCLAYPASIVTLVLIMVAGIYAVSCYHFIGQAQRKVERQLKMFSEFDGFEAEFDKIFPEPSNTPKLLICVQDKIGEGKHLIRQTLVMRDDHEFALVGLGYYRNTEGEGLVTHTERLEPEAAIWIFEESQIAKARALGLPRPYTKNGDSGADPVLPGHSASGDDHGHSDGGGDGGGGDGGGGDGGGGGGD